MHALWRSEPPSRFVSIRFVPYSWLSIIPSDLSPEAEDALVEMLLNCASITLDGLREIEQSRGASILDTTVFCQVILAMALARGNRQLVKDILGRLPPRPGP